MRFINILNFYNFNTTGIFYNHEKASYDKTGTPSSSTTCYGLVWILTEDLSKLKLLIKLSVVITSFKSITGHR